MTLLRGFSKVNPVAAGTGEGGRIPIPSNMREKAGISAGSIVEIMVIRIKGSGRWPHIIVHASGIRPQLSMLQVVMKEEKSRIDDEAGLILADDTLDEAKLETGYRVEIKLTGPHHASWLVIHNRGPARLTTLQEKIGRLGHEKTGRSGTISRKWKSMTIEY